MSQEYTISALTNRNVPDKYGNLTFTVKFAESAESVYAAFKTAPNIGDKRYGDIIGTGEGARFKSAKRPDQAPFQGGGTSYPSSSASPRKSDDERSQDIRWGLCIKEANAYVCRYIQDKDAEDWAKAVNEYANALYSISAAPTIDKVTQLMGGDDVILEDIDDKPIDLGPIPF